MALSRVGCISARCHRYRRATEACLVFPQVGMEVAHPGVSNDFGDVDARKYYTYYQWVCFVLFFQVGRKPPPPFYR